MLLSVMSIIKKGVQLGGMEETTTLRRLQNNGVPTELCVNIPSSAIVCNVCLNILRCPTSICDNEHFFCETCLQTHMNQNVNASCPSCRTRTNAKYHSRTLQTIIDDTEVYCFTNLKNSEFMNAEVGAKRSIHTISCCQWKGTLSQLSEHLKKECQYVDRVKELEADVKELEKSTKRMKLTIETLQLEKTQFKQQLRELKKVNSEYKKESIKNNRDLSNAQEENKSYRTQIQSQMSQINEIRLSCYEKNAENSKLKKQLNLFLYDINNNVPTANIVSDWKVMKVPQVIEGGKFTVSDEKRKYTVTYPNATPGQMIAVKVPCNISHAEENNDLELQPLPFFESPLFKYIAIMAILSCIVVALFYVEKTDKQLFNDIVSFVFFCLLLCWFYRR